MSKLSDQEIKYFEDLGREAASPAYYESDSLTKEMESYEIDTYKEHIECKLRDIDDVEFYKNNRRK